MSQNDHAEDHGRNRILFSLFYFLAAFQGLIAFYYQTSIPTESREPVFFGVSAVRLLFLGLILGLALCFCACGVLLIRRSRWASRQHLRLLARLDRKPGWMVLLLIAIGSSLSGSYFLLLRLDITEPFTLAYFIRLQPLAGWLTGLGLQTLLFFPWLQPGFAFRAPSRLVTLSAVLFAFFLLLWGWIAWSRVGLKAETVGWNRLGAPILETQTLLAWILGLGFLALCWLIERNVTRITLLGRLAPFRIDLALSLLVWLFAFASWQAAPLLPSWFASPPQPPTHQWYPNTDASVYDITAQNALVGGGYKSWEASHAVRPLYAWFLSVLHLIAGLGYEPIITYQLAVLALFPVGLYWLARRFHSRLGGVLSASLIVFREANAIALADTITVSHAKLLMSDLPTALGVALFMVAVCAWLQQPSRQPARAALLAGGILGAFMLVRPEVASLAPVVALVAAGLYWRQPLGWLKQMAWFGVGLALLLTPWLWHNWQAAGTIYLDSPNFRADLLAKRYSPDPVKADVTQLPAETTQEYTERMAENAKEFIQANKESVIGFIRSHYFNSQVQMVLALPASFRLVDSAFEFLAHRSSAVFWDQCCSASSYVKRLPFWRQWDGNLPWQSVIPLLLNLLLLAIGISSSWLRLGLVGLLPLLGSCAYLLINAIFRNSGGRYIVPVDWVSVFYFSIGLAQLTLWAVASISRRLLPSMAQPTSSAVTPRAQPIPGWKATAACLLVLLLAGALLPITEAAFPQRYPEELKQALLVEWLAPTKAALEPKESQALNDFMQAGGQVLFGRALYPRFYRAGKGDVGDTWASFMAYPYPRLSFYLVGPQNRGIILPYQNPQIDFPNGVDVLVFGCQTERYFDSFAVIAVDSEAFDQGKLLLRDPLPSPSCPLPKPD